MRQFLVSITKEDDFFIARCPELNVTSQGETLEEAEENIKEAIELYIESFGTEDLSQQVSKPYLTLVEVSNV
ncbi:MAG TPA: type II toxin-antitoxin system HicB family antitoxin [Methanosarcina sp.]|jgi:predicted RNase H-like HicB family nuclease|nr:type II toxin-antitoxin system HicB family antitoxin [Methanosarcina sp.]